MAGGSQRKRGGPSSERHGKIAAGGTALIGDLMAQDGDYFEKFSTFAGGTSGFATACRGVLIAGSQDGRQTVDKPAMCDKGGWWSFPLSSPATAYAPSETKVGASGDRTVDLLTAGVTGEAIGELVYDCQVGDTSVTFRFYENDKAVS